MPSRVSKRVWTGAKKVDLHVFGGSVTEGLYSFVRCHKGGALAVFAMKMNNFGGPLGTLAQHLAKTFVFGAGQISSAHRASEHHGLTVLHWKTFGQDGRVIPDSRAEQDQAGPFAAADAHDDFCTGIQDGLAVRTAELCGHWTSLSQQVSYLWFFCTTNQPWQGMAGLVLESKSHDRDSITAFVRPSRAEVRYVR
jgi:hypothetical protein